MTFYLNLHFLIPYYIIQRMNKIHYCPIGQIQRQFGVYVTGAGKETTNPGEPYPHAYHSSDYYFTWKKGRALADWEYQLLYIRTGKGEIEFQRGQRIPIEGGTVIILHRLHKLRIGAGFVRLGNSVFCSCAVLYNMVSKSAN